MMLTVPERLTILSVLPSEGDLTTLRIVRDLRAGLSFSEEEHVKFGLKQDMDKGSVSWANGEAVEVPFGARAQELIVETFERLAKAKKLTLAQLPVYERFLIREA